MIKIGENQNFLSLIIQLIFYLKVKIVKTL